MVSYEVLLMKRGIMSGKKVMVQASNKSEAFKKALGLQPNAGTWYPMTATVEASRMESKFRHKGLRYSR